MFKTEAFVFSLAPNAGRNINWLTVPVLWCWRHRGPEMWLRAQGPRRVFLARRTGTPLGSFASADTAFVSSRPGLYLWPGRCRPFCGTLGSWGGSAPVPADRPPVIKHRIPWRRVTQSGCWTQHNLRRINVGVQYFQIFFPFFLMDLLGLGSAVISGCIKAFYNLFVRL